MKILVTNDDGINAPGLWAVAEALRDVGEVVVVAPDREQSGVGTSITLHVPVRASQVASQINGVAAFEVEGTPADSVILALGPLVGPVDLLVSGINQGSNLGEDVLVSGTVGATLQGYVRGVPSIAVSVAALKDVHFEMAARLAKLLAQSLAEGLLPRPMLLNVNLPNSSPESVKGVDVTRMGRRSYTEIAEEGNDGKRKYYWIKRQHVDQEPMPGTDIWSVRNKRISITPLCVDLTDKNLMDGLAALTGQVIAPRLGLT